jgi:hypothetical protein
VLAGRTTFSLWTAWHYAGVDPYRLYRMLDDDYRPVWNSEHAPERPRHPERLRRFMYGLGRASAIIDGKMEDPMPFRGKQVRKGRPEAEGKGERVILDHKGDVIARV